MVARCFGAAVLRREELAGEIDGAGVFGEFVSVLGLLWAGKRAGRRDGRSSSTCHHVFSPVGLCTRARVASSRQQEPSIAAGGSDDEDGREHGKFGERENGVQGTRTASGDGGPFSVTDIGTERQ